MVARILRTGLLMVFSFGVLMTVEAYAQTGALRGTVVNEQKQPVAGVQVLISFLGGMTREFKAETNENGNFIRVGLQPGNYKLSFSKEGHQSFEITEIRVRIGDPMDVGEIMLPSVSDEMKAAMKMKEVNAEIAEEFNAGIAAAEAEDYRGAIAAFEKVIAIHPGSAEAYFNKGFAHSKLGESAEAEAAYNKAIELDSSYAEPFIELSNIYAERTEWAKAEEMLQKAVAIRPDDARYQYNLGATAMNAADLATAEVAFRKVLELDPTFADAYYQLGMVNVNKGSNAEAITELEKYLELAPDGPNAAVATGIINHLKQQPPQ
jgi:Flp pilus assembly protein TadD